MSEFTERHLSCRVGALLDHPDLGLWLGMGGRLVRYQSGREMESQRIFQGAFIHGLIRPNPMSPQLIVYGGKKLALVTLHPAWGVTAEVESPDWIQRIHPLSSVQAGFLVLTSHNRVHHLTWAEGVVQTWDCEEKCILYSGLFVPAQDPDEPVVLSGTVFQEIVVWCPSRGPEVLHRLQGHEGVLFSLEYHSGRQLICSTSDDRTARVWQVEFPTSAQDWSRASFQCIWVLRGHRARIFRSLILDAMIVLGGEDSQVSFWRADVLVRAEAEAHQASPVWALARSASGEDVFSGGGDSSVRKWSILADQSLPLAELTSPDFNLTNCYPRAVKDFGEWALAIVGNCTVRALRGDQSHLLWQADAHITIGLLEVEDDSLFVTSNCGQLWCLHLEINSEMPIHCSARQPFKLYNGKIFSVQALRYRGDLRLLTCGPNGALKLFRPNQTMATEYQLPVPSESKASVGQWVNSAVIHSESDTLFVGDRYGSLFRYSLKTEATPSPVVQKLRIHKLHGMSGIDASKPRQLRTIGRDGYLKRFDLESEERLVESLSTRLPFDWLEVMLNIDGDHDLILGFHGSYFIIYSLKECRILGKVACGGSHRSWTFRPNGDQSTFTFIKDRRIYRQRILLNAMVQSCRKQAIHSREICAIQHLEVQNQHFIFTAGEDVDIRVHRLTSAPTERSSWDLRTDLVLRSHLSSVKGLDLVELAPNREISLLVSVGGRAQIKAWRVMLSQDSSLTVSELASHLLRGGDKRRSKTWRDSKVIYDTETRYTDVAIDPCEPHSMFVAGSDCILRKFNISEDMSRISLTLESNPIRHAFLSVRVDEDEVITTSNDGFIRFWDKSKLKVLSEKMVTKSGLNIASSIVDAHLFVGGDGGEIARVISPSLATEVYPACHATQINGMVRLSSTELITSSVDQRISSWATTPHDQEGQLGHKLHLTRQVCTDIADAQCLAAWKVNGDLTLAIGGQGIAIYQWGNHAK